MMQIIENKIIAILTTLLFNSFCLPEQYINRFGFINSTVDSDVYDNLQSNLALLLTNKDLSSELYSDTIDRISWLGFQMTNVKGLNMDFDSITMSKKFIDKKNKVYQELKETNASNKEVLDKEAELIKEAIAEKKDSGLVHIIKSGSKGNFSNNYKTLNIGRGIVQKPLGDGFVLLNNSLAEGNKPSDYVQLSNNSILGSFGRSLKTANGGYLSKLITSGFSYLEVIPDEDCGTKAVLKTKITSSNYKLFLNRYIRLTGRQAWEDITLDNYKDFLNKEVEIRSPMYCKHTKGICGMCYGSLYKKNEITKGINTLLMDLTSNIMNKSMKSFHDLTKKVFELDFTKFIK